MSFKRGLEMASRLSLLLCSALLFLSLFNTITADLAADRDALLRLIPALRGRTLSWNQSNPSPCFWAGVTCDPNINRVTVLRLPGYGLSGQIPVNSIGNLTQLQILSLRSNTLSGPIPSDLGSCTELRLLVLQENRFTGDIPVTLFSLTNLVRMSLARNNLSGVVSPAFNDLFRLRVLLLNNNQLTGSLPELSNLTELTECNVSSNRLNGSIPSRLSNFPASSFQGNSLCGSPLNPCQNGGNSLSTGALVGIIVGSVTVSLLVLAILLFFWRRRRVSEIPQRSTLSIPPSPEKPPQYDFQDPNSMVVRDYNDSSGSWGRMESSKEASVMTKSVGGDGLVFFGEGRFNLEELLRASAEVLGKGTIGTTYKAYLDSGGVAIVKRLKHVPVSEREFRHKIESLGELVHENWVHLRGYYYGIEEKLLIYDWMPMGNLSAILHGNRGGYREELTWEVRSSIIYQVAQGVDYLHSLGPTFTHGNIKASNIFLTDRLRACVSEFGIAQLVSSYTPNLLGYRAPEVVDSHKISRKADVYSFGVLILELLSGKAPTDAMNEDGVDLPKWVQSVVEEKWTKDVFDPDLLKYQNMEEQMVQLLHLAFRCTSQYPERRPEMREVVVQIRNICGARLERHELQEDQNEERYS